MGRKSVRTQFEKQDQPTWWSWYLQSIPSNKSGIHILFTHTPFIETDHILGHSTRLNKFKRIQVIQIMFSRPNRINLGINVQVSRKPPNLGKVSYTPKQLMGQRRNQRIFWTEWKRDMARKNCSQMFSFLVWGKETFYNLGTRVTFAQGWNANSFWLRSVPQSVLRGERWLIEAGARGRRQILSGLEVYVRKEWSRCKSDWTTVIPLVIEKRKNLRIQEQHTENPLKFKDVNWVCYEQDNIEKTVPSP